MTLDDLFGVRDQISWPQECARAVLVFAYGLALVRIAGRRLFGKWAALDVVVSIVIGSNLSRALTGNAPLWGTLGATALIVGLHWLLSHAAARSGRLSKLLEGRSVELAEDGRVDAAVLVRHAISASDLAEAVRAAGIDDAAKARRLTLEPSGKISVLKNP